MAKKYIVTGGGGFVGKAICLKLLQLGHQVISVARGSYPELEKLSIRHVQLDLSKDGTKLQELAQEADAIFHVAAKVDMWGNYHEFFAGNVIATRNVIKACRTAKVKKLIFTSSPSVIADGRDLLGVDESYPYPAHYDAFYPQTKAIAEREVLAANGLDDLHTIVLRPHLIWGPGDTNLVPTIIAKAKAGKLMKVGSGGNLTDLTFIDDCVNAHILALAALDSNPNAAGRAYFISQGQPVKMWDWIDDVLRYHELPQVSKTISYPLAKKLAWICEFFAKILPGNKEPLLTKFLVCEMATSHFFNINAARQELGYQPKYTIEEALVQTFGL